MVAFTLWSLKIHRYGIMYVVGLTVAYCYLFWIKKHPIIRIKHPGVQNFLTKHLDDLFVWIICGIIVGGRLGEVLLYNFDFYLANPWQILAIQNGWMSFIGGFIGVMTVIFVLKKLHKRSRSDLRTMFDLLVSILPLGIIAGRFGNFLNQELYGLPASQLGLSTNTIQQCLQRNICHTYPQIDQLIRINTNLLSMLLEGWLVFLILQTILWVTHHRHQTLKPGLLTWRFCVLYGVTRFGLDYLRYDSSLEYIGALTTTQRLMVILIATWIRLAARPFKSHQ